MSSPQCPICNSTHSKIKFNARDHHYGNEGSWVERECSGCGSFFLDPLPDARELLRMYPDDTYYSFQLRPERPLRRRLLHMVGVRLGTREPALNEPGSVLDFGCGAGEFLVSMRRKGWTVSGVEVNPGAIRRARDLGLDVRPELSGESGFSDAKFDYIRANHSLEHLPNPGLIIQDFFRFLRPGGTLFIGVPTNDGFAARAFGKFWWYLSAPVHPVTFSTRGLIGLVERAGFTVTRVSTNSDWGSLTGSLQIFLNRNSARRSTEGLIFRIKPLLLIGQWLAKLQDVLGAGDKVELIAKKPER